MTRTFYAITRKNKEGKTVCYDYYNQVWLTEIDMDCLFLKKSSAETVIDTHWKKDYCEITAFELKEMNK